MNYRECAGAADCGEYRQAAGTVRSKRLDRLRLNSVLPPQYRVLDGQQAFPSFERHNPKRTCLLAYRPFLPAYGTLELAVCIRLRRASNNLRTHPRRAAYRANAKLL
jgi:hypothetical protein